jgi:hypothetical protein
VNPEFYLPGEALQGQNIPCHLIWSKIDWISIEVRFSNQLRIFDVFNVDDNMIQRLRNKIVIKELNWDGYLCVEFETKRTKELSKKAIVEVTFISSGNKKIKMKKEINLFRPNLQLMFVPKKIIVNEKGIPSEKIQLSRIGFGTILVGINCTEDSEVQCSFPSGFIEMINQLTKDVNIEISKLRKRYPQYSKIFKSMEGFDYSNKDESINKISATIERVSPEKDFVDEFINAMFTAMVKNSDFETMVIRPIVEFMKSTIGNRIIFSTPFLELNCETKEKKMKIEIECFDLLAFEISRIKVPAIVIKGEKKKKIQIGDIIDWRSSGIPR